MNKTVYKVLVPTDFSKVAECAMEHAAKVANIFSGEIHLLHVVSKQSEVENALEKLDKIAEEASAKYKISFNTIVRIGNIFEDIGDVAAEIKARLIIMGTHGVKGIQHLVGSYALKVITHSKVPFIVVQERGARDGYKNIVLPVDNSQETKQKLSLTANMAKHFGAKVHIFAPKETDEFRITKLNRDLTFAKNYLEEKEIPFDIQIAEDKKGFVKQLIHYSARIDADLLAAVNTHDSVALPDFLVGGEEQDLIANDAEIPVMIMNPTQEFIASSILFT